MSDSLWPQDCGSSVSSVLGLLQARIPEWIAIPFSKGSFWPRSQTQVSCIAGRFFTTQVSHIAGRRFNLSATREADLSYREVQIKHNSQLFKTVRWLSFLLVPLHWLCKWKPLTEGKWNIYRESYNMAIGFKSGLSPKHSQASPADIYWGGNWCVHLCVCVCVCVCERERERERERESSRK